jgi:phage terminase large subunit
MEYTDQGIFTILGQNSVTAGISAVKVRLEAHRLLVTANCQSLIDEFRKYRWATPTRTEDDAKEKPVKTDDHLLDALRYVVASRPYTSPEEQGWVPQNEFDLRMKEEMTGKSYRRKRIPASPMGGIFA